MLITFSGLDGAGKSTLIEHLKTSLEQRGRSVTVFHNNDHVGVYAYVRAVRDRLVGPPQPNGQGAKRSGALGAALKQIRKAILWNKPLRRLIYPVDLAAFLFYRLYFEKIRKHVLIMDRYFYDTLVDVADGRHWGWLRLLERLTPTPDMPVFLDITPEESFARKGEYSVPYLQRRATAYRKVFPWVRSAVMLENHKLSTTAATLERLVLARLNGSPGGTAARHPTESAELLLRLLLTGTADLKGVSAHAWDDLARVARSNAVLLRAAACLERVALDGSERFVASAAHERQRAQALLAAIHATSRACSDGGIAHLFPKAFRHYPDMGSDVDLLVLARPAEFTPILAALRAQRLRGGFSNWLAATERYALAGCPAPLDVQYGRLGLVGEHAGYASQLVNNWHRTAVDGTQVCVPAIEDQVVLEGIQRVFGRRSLRLADIVWAVRALGDVALDWDYVVRTASRIGVTHGLGCFLSYVEQIHRRILPGALVPTDVRRQLPVDGWGPVEFRDDRYRFPSIGVNARLSLKALQAKLVRHDWAGAARLSLVPLVGMATALSRLPHPETR